jgi:ABC-type transporter Mla subunit MlaD
MSTIAQVQAKLNQIGGSAAGDAQMLNRQIESISRTIAEINQVLEGTYGEDAQTIRAVALSAKATLEESQKRLQQLSALTRLFSAKLG